METSVLIAVLAAAFVHASWNAMAKGRGRLDPFDASLLMTLGGGAVALPLLAFTGLPADASHVAVAASAVVHLAYFVLVGMIYRHANYAVAYPIMRGTPPLISALAGAVWLGEWLSPGATGGLLLVVSGVLLLGWRGLSQGHITRPALGLIALNVVVIVAYTLIDGIGGRRSGSAYAYVLAMMLLTALLALPMAAVRWRESKWRPSLSDWARSAVGGAMIMLSYGTAIWAMTRAPIGVIAAVRETSVLFAVLIGRVMLGEHLGRVGMVGAVVIVAGLALIRLG